MSSPVHTQADGLRVLAKKLNTHTLVKATAMRSSGADHLIMMLRDAAETLDRLINEGCENCGSCPS